MVTANTTIPRRTKNGVKKKPVAKIKAVFQHTVSYPSGYTLVKLVGAVTIPFCRASLIPSDKRVGSSAEEDFVKMIARDDRYEVTVVSADVKVAA